MTNRITYALFSLLALGCIEEELDLGELPRAAPVSICLDPTWSECRIDLAGNGCTPVESDACAAGGPLVCTELAGLCVVPWPGDSCPPGWHEACGYYEQ